MADKSADKRTEKDRDQLTPAEPEDRDHLERKRGQGTAGSGRDQLPGEDSAPGGSAGE